MKSPRAYMDPNVAQAAREAGLDVPDPNSADFEQKIIDLSEAGSPWAGRFQSGVIYSGLGDPREAFRKETRKQARKRALHNRLFRRQDPDTGEHVNDKNKLWFLGAAGALAVVLLFLGMTLVGTLDRANAQEVSFPQGDAAPADGGSVTLSTPTDTAATDAGLLSQVRTFGTRLDEKLAGESDLVGVNLEGELVDPTSSGAAADAAAESDTSSGAAEAATESGPAVSALVVAQPRAASSSVVARVVPTTPLTLDARKANRSAVVVTRQKNLASSSPRAASLSSSILSSREGPRAVGVAPRAPETATPDPAEDSAAQAVAETPPAPEPQPLGGYEGPDLYAQAESATGTFASGDVLDGVLEVGILTTEGASVPTLVRTDGGVWQGSASLNSLGRVEVTLSQVTAEGQQLSVNALVVGEDGYPGVDAAIREATPALAADLVAAGLRGVSDYVGELADAGTVVDDGERVVVNNQAVPLEWALAGSLAELFSPPSSQRAVVRVAEVPAGTRVSVRVF